MTAGLGHQERSKGDKEVTGEGLLAVLAWSLKALARAKCRGFTLVEVLVAALLLGLCVGGFCTLAVVARETSDKARAHYTAINLAKNRLERARVFGFDQLSGFVENQVVVDRNGNPSSSGDYRRTTTVRAVSSNLVEVIVTVEIRDRITRTFGKESETLRSYVAKYVARP